MPPKITLWASKKGAKLRASWRDDGKRTVFYTGEADEKQAMARAIAERSRRLSHPPTVLAADRATPVQAAGSTPPVSSSPPPAPWTPGAAAPPPPRPQIGATLRLLSAPMPAGDDGPPPPKEREPAIKLDEKTQAMYAVFGRVMARLNEAALKMAVRAAGREPEEMDEDEVAMVQSGWADKGADWFGRAEIGPWGKIMLGSVAAGFGMYMAGTPIEKKEESRQLPPIEAPAHAA